MDIKQWALKRLTVPERISTKEVDAVQLWEVRWISRHGEFSSDTRPEVEAFPTEAEANAFAEALRSAFALIRHTGSRSYVRVEKAR